MSEMKHFEILFSMIILMTGLASISYIRQQDMRLRLPWLRYLGAMILFLNVVVFIDLTATYSCINLIRDCNLIRVVAWHKIAGQFSSFFFILLVATLFVVGKNVQGNITLPSKRILTLSTSVLLLLYAPRIVLIILNRYHPFLEIHSKLLMGGYLMGLIFLAYLVIRPRSTDAGWHNRVVIPFVMAVLIPWVLPLIPFYWDGASRILTVLPAFLLFNILPVLWFRWMFLPTVNTEFFDPSQELNLDGLCRTIKISKREREIARLILLGKSNKEIEDDLCISLSTVKNHIYNLYRKLGISSRTQLIRLVLDTHHPVESR